MDLKKIFYTFNTGAEFLDCTRFGSGHIHETYFVETVGNSTPDYLLQKLNQLVFKDLASLQSNIERVTTHIRAKLVKEGVNDIDRKTLTPIPALNGDFLVRESNGDTWRMFLFIPDHQSFDIVDSPDKAYQGGRAIGRFQALLTDLPEPPLFETIPYFHDIEKRLATFYETVRKDPVGRVSSLGKEINFVKDRQEVMKTVHKLGLEGKIPVRITHNDTKFNNILFDSDNKALCIIDLDTVMPGYVHYDFGDAIRTAASSAAEDETDLSKVFLDLRLFSAYASGYLDELRDTLNDTEKEYLAFAPRLITFTIGLRFLTDHIDGDKYFRIHHKDHNLHRALAQFRLVESNEDQYEEMKRIISSLS